MPTSQATLILHEVEHSKPISAKTREFQHRRFQNRIRGFLLRTFREQQKKTGLTQKELAERIDSRPEQINRWLSIPGNLTVNTICDLLLGMAVDLNDPSATPLADLAREADRPAVSAPEEIQRARNIIPMNPNVIILSYHLAPNVALHQNQANTAPQPVAVPSPSSAGLGYLTHNFNPGLLSGSLINERRRTYDRPEPDAARISTEG